MPVLSSTVKNTHYAKMATTSRLIACLVSESLVKAIFVPSDDPTMKGLCILLRPQKSTLTSLNDILAIVPLRGVPIIDPSPFLIQGMKCANVILVDGWDMLPHIYTPTMESTKTTHLLPPVINAKATTDAVAKKLSSLLLHPIDSQQLLDGFDAVQLWTQFATDFNVNEKLIQLISQELDSSMLYQAHAYNHPKMLPSLESSTVEWEQIILEGHATHPMHKARKSFAPMAPLHPEETNLENPKIRLVAIPKDCMQLRGDFETLSQPLVDIILSKSTGGDDDDNIKLLRKEWSNHILMPVHELQVVNIQQLFPKAYIFPEVNHITVQSLTSIRSVAIPELFPGMSLKLCLGIKVSSALRTITPYSTYFGPGFSSEVVPHLTYDPQVLTIERELASAVYIHDDTDIAKHCSCVLREAVEYDVDNQDTIVPCAALVEKIQQPDTDITLVKHVWNLDTDEKRVDFLDRYIDLALQAFLPPALINGVAFEAHGQNTLARFDKKTGLLKGFVIRDFGGIKVHRETLIKSAGVDIDVLPDSCVVADTKDEVFKLLYHTLIHSHLQRLIRVLDLHYDGRGWAMVRKHLNRLVPKDHFMWKSLMEEDKVPGKCLVRMKIEELYRDYIYSPVPNVIQYRPSIVL
ncbi:IucC family-domain-containing protein [Halteromyces radiatus]|uniref:IucC family-domain-containing protein n=1 Tax=Halteromyces radiatus TaxID=101107 RepID=UPI0022206D67|nr:IucC family-domain-containing protein [Halteromyces radiatus]KAI8089336.1 IucC family-domain-containing protein [Halteromyces radiatus]